MEDPKKSPSVNATAVGRAAADQLDFSSSAEFQLPGCSLEEQGRARDFAGDQSGGATVPADPAPRPINREGSPAESGVGHSVKHAQAITGYQQNDPPEQRARAATPPEERRSNSDEQPAAQPISAPQGKAATAVVLRPDMTEEELDQAADRLRPASVEQLAIALARRYERTIRGMRKRGTKYAPIMAALEQGPDGAEFKKHFDGNHRKLSRYLREKCAKN
ncbi:hypothetical protein [Sphingomonas sp. LHG3443-2]|uniref:hypothetical protein n=1 Tax=Sphingomonas sp. LHG3443-2 TaxID=2804639 RepID=UPI003CF03D52